MDCCLTALSHYLNRCLIFSEILFCGVYLTAISLQVPKVLYCIRSFKIVLLTQGLATCSSPNKNVDFRPPNLGSANVNQGLWCQMASLGCGRFEYNFRQVIFKLTLVDLNWWKINIGSGNGLVPSDNKPLPVPMLTQFYVAIWRH